MAKSTNIPGQGDVMITLDGEDYYLRPTARAAITISRVNDGIRGAIRKIVELDMDVMLMVIRTGLGPNVVRQIGGDFEDIVWRAGMTDANASLVAKCVEFCHVLANGGRPTQTRDDGDEDKDPRPPTVQ